MTYIPVAMRGREGGSQIEAGESGEPAFTVRTPGGGSSLPMVAYALGSHAGAADGGQTNSSHASGGPVGSNISEGLAYSLRAGRNQSVAAIPAPGSAAPGPGGHLIAHPLTAREGKGTDSDVTSGNLVTHPLTSEGADASEDGTGRGTPLVAVPVAWRGRGMEAGEENIANALRSAGDGHVGDQMGYVMTSAVPISQDALRGGEGVARTPSYDAAGCLRLRDPGLNIGKEGDPAATLAAAGPGAVGTASAVRRLTPLECERLQGFPDRWTLHQADGSEQSDSARYRQLGNSVAVPCVAWITRRIAAAEAHQAAARGAA